jgi:hypothetical protein
MAAINPPVSMARRCDVRIRGVPFGESRAFVIPGTNGLLLSGKFRRTHAEEQGLWSHPALATGVNGHRRGCPEARHGSSVKRLALAAGLSRTKTRRSIRKSRAMRFESGVFLVPEAIPSQRCTRTRHPDRLDSKYGPGSGRLTICDVARTSSSLRNELLTPLTLRPCFGTSK